MARVSVATLKRLRNEVARLSDAVTTIEPGSQTEVAIVHAATGGAVAGVPQPASDHVGPVIRVLSVPRGQFLRVENGITLYRVARDPAKIDEHIRALQRVGTAAMACFTSPTSENFDALAIAEEEEAKALALSRMLLPALVPATVAPPQYLQNRATLAVFDEVEGPYRQLVPIGDKHLPIFDSVGEDAPEPASLIVPTGRPRTVSRDEEGRIIAPPAVEAEIARVMERHKKRRDSVLAMETGEVGAAELFERLAAPPPRNEGTVIRLGKH